MARSTIPRATSNRAPASSSGTSEGGPDEQPVAAGLGLTLALKLFGAVAVLAGVAVALTQRGRIELPWSNYLRSHGELAPLANLGFCFVFASLSGYVGLSPSYGAFLAGLILGASTDRRSAFFMVAPMQSVLLMVFFLSIGLLIDLNFVLAHLLTVLFLVFVVGHT